MRRRVWLGGVGVAGLAGAGQMLYSAAPGFWRQFGRDMNRPILQAPEQPALEQWSDKGLYAAWLGHATVLIKADGFTIITDPVLHDRVGLSLGPVTLGLKRLVAPALKSRQLPKIDLILLSHAHMDHLDLPSLRNLESRKTSVIMARQTSDLIPANRYRQVRELGWGEQARVEGINVKALQVNHWGARMRTDSYRGYNGYLIEVRRYRILFAGDTAYTSSFRGLRGGRSIDLGIMPIGAYNPWIRVHCTPEQAWQMGNEAGADRLIPVHHQTFQLSREPLREPIERFIGAAESHRDRVALERIGQEIRI